MAQIGLAAIGIGDGEFLHSSAKIENFFFTAARCQYRYCRNK